MGEFDGASALGKVKVPVLSIGSAVPANEPADLRSACPAITIGQTVGAGHFVQLEVPEQVNAMIEQFMAINQLSRPRSRLPRRLRRESLDGAESRLRSGPRPVTTMPGPANPCPLRSAAAAGSLGYAARPATRC